MRVAYADPPYPGQARRHYAGHADYAGEVDHAELLLRLERDYPDGWALSTSAAAIRPVLLLCPESVRLCVWHLKNPEPPGNRGTWWWSWEGLLVKATRQPEIPTHDVLYSHSPKGFLGNEITGQKPPAFCRWMFALLGLGPDDELVDLFPGSGAVLREWEAWRSQLNLLTETA